MDETVKNIIIKFKEWGWIFKEKNNYTSMSIQNDNHDQIFQHYALKMQRLKLYPFITYTQGINEYYFPSVPWNPEFNSDNPTCSWGLQEYFESKGWESSPGNDGFLVLKLKNSTKSWSFDSVSQKFYYNIFSVFNGVHINVPFMTTDGELIVKFENVKYLHLEKEHEKLCKQLDIPLYFYSNFYNGTGGKLLEIKIPNNHEDKQKVIATLNEHLSKNDEVSSITYDKYVYYIKVGIHIR